MLSWTLILLLKHPASFQKLKQEVETAISNHSISKEDLDSLPFLTACVKETLRLYPSAFSHSVKLREEAIHKDAPGLGKEQYRVSRSDVIRLNLLAIQRDPLIYGEDADQFRPERMLDEEFKKLPRNSWKASLTYSPSRYRNVMVVDSSTNLAIRNRCKNMHR